MVETKYLAGNIKEHQMIKLKLWLCLATMVPLVACTGNASSTPKYAILVRAARGKLLFAQPITYAIDEKGAVLDLHIPEGVDSEPEWSPDGQWIAHVKINSNAGSVSDRDIFLTRANGSGQSIQVTNNPRPEQSPTWSTDGAQIAFHSPDNRGRNEIFLLDVECTLQDQACALKPVSLTVGDYPDWSPDGKKIVYRDTSKGGIYVVDIHNPNEIVKVSRDLNRCNSPQWSPTGSKIAFVCDETIYSVDPDGGNLVSLISGALYLRWTPDGKQIAFIGTATLDSSLGQSLDLEGMVVTTAVFIMDVSGANVTRITKNNEESISWFAWLPTGSAKSGP